VNPVVYSTLLVKSRSNNCKWNPSTWVNIWLYCSSVSNPKLQLSNPYLILSVPLNLLTCKQLLKKILIAMFNHTKFDVKKYCSHHMYRFKVRDTMHMIACTIEMFGQLRYDECKSIAMSLSLVIMICLLLTLTEAFVWSY
jgi:hypothetical protein